VSEEAGPRLADQLRAKGYRLTPQRQLVLEAVGRLGHATPDDIVGEVHRTAAAVNVSTIYRTLDLLEALGLVTHTHLGHGAPTYHAASDERHVHLVCQGCGHVTEVDPSSVHDTVARLEREQGFRVDVGHLAVAGWCRECGPGGA
jgi:Fur family ferric uptake transcriptional regulator